jgi:hypothetical protein
MIKPMVAVALAICVTCTEPATGADRGTWTFGFEEAKEGNLPDAFRAGMTGTWKATEWRVREFEGNRVLAHVGFWGEDPEGVYPVCWVKEPAAEDLTLTVRLFPVRPPGDIPKAHHDGAGIVVRFKDPMNYYLLRAVPHEARVRLYKVVNGRRSTLAGRNLEVGVARGTRSGSRLPEARSRPISTARNSSPTGTQRSPRPAPSVCGPNRTT